MIAISKEEKDVIGRQFPKVHIVRTMRQRSARHRYYMEEERRAMAMLSSIRAAKCENHVRKGV